ncbi:MAG: LPP20 family lipoprotein [Marinomonas sp.]
MMRLLKAGVVTLSFFALAGCSSVLTKDLVNDGCKYPDNLDVVAPNWVCNHPVDDLEIQAVGYSRKLASGPGMMTDVATTEARARLTGYFASEVKTRLSRLTTDSQTEEGTTNADVSERIQKTLATMTLTKSRIYRTQTSPKGNMYVLVGLNKAAYAENMEALVNTALNDDSPELYRQFLMEESDKSLDQVRQELGGK